MTPAAIVRRNLEAFLAEKRGRELCELRNVNDWLKLQLESQWRIENYRPAPTSEKRVMRAAA